MKIKYVDIVEGPLYEELGEDGYYTYYDYFIVATAEDGQTYTLKRSFNRHEKDKRDRVFKRISDSLVIDIEHWYEGSVWDSYLIPQTYEEEKRDALEFERNIGI